MRHKTPSVEPLVRKAFGLLMELRGHREAPRLLTQAVTLLQTLTRDGDLGETPVVFSCRVVHLRKL